MKLVRKRLWAGEIVNAALIYDSDCDCVKQTFDGGATYVDSPASDPRSAPQFQKPPVTTDDPQCQAAANFITSIQNYLGGMSTIISAATTAEGLLTTVIGGMAVFFPEAASIGVLAFLALDLATVLFDAGLTAINAAFTTDAYEDIKCAYLANCEADGSMTAGDLSAFLIAIGSTPGGLAATVLDAVFAFAGEVGASNLAASGLADANCDHCRGIWCHTFDFTLSDDFWTVDNGIYSPGVGFVQPGTGSFPYTVDLVCDEDLSAAGIISIGICAISTTVTSSGFRGWYASGGLSGTCCKDQHGSYILSFTGLSSINPASLSVQVSNSSDVGNNTITCVTLRGTGVSPFGDDNC